VILLNDSGEVVWQVRASDNTYFNTVTNTRGYDGVITFNNAPADNYNVIILLADDEPTQNTSFTGDLRFTNSKLEGAFDALSGQIQRIKYQINRVPILPDYFTDNFDMTLPEPVGSGVLIVNEDNNGFEFVPLATIHEIIARLDNAEADIVDHESRISILEALSLGIITTNVDMYAPVGTGAVSDFIYDRKVFVFTPLASQVVTFELKRSDDETTNRKTVTFSWFADANNVKWTLTAYLVKSGAAVDSTAYTYTESTEVVVPGNKMLVNTTLNFTSVGGQIGAQGIDDGDAVFVKITRDAAAGTEAGDAYIIPHLTKVLFN
jgi:hypothetical protein